MSLLWEAMQRTDAETGRSRGFMVLRSKEARLSHFVDCNWRPNEAIANVQRICIVDKAQVCSACSPEDCLKMYVPVKKGPRTIPREFKTECIGIASEN